MHFDNNGSYFPAPSIIAQRPLRHFPRNTTSGGPHHLTVVIIAVSVSVGGLLLAAIFWRIVTRRSRSAPLPKRQALVHQRELQLVAFTEHKNASVPKFLQDGPSESPVHHGSRLSWVPYVRHSFANTSNTPSSSNDEADERVEAAAPSSPYESSLHPPTPPFFAPRIPSSASSPNLHLSSGRSSLSSDGAHAPTSISPSGSPNHSLRRAVDRSRSRRRPYSMASIGTSQTTHSRQSVRAAPHAPHSNIQIVLPAPLAPNVYERAANEELQTQRPLVVECVYADSWRSSMADTWIPVGQHDGPEPDPTERQRSYDSMQRRSRLTRSMCTALLTSLSYS